MSRPLGEEKVRVIFLLVLALSLAWGLAQSAVVKYMTLAQVAKESDLIIQGTVAGVEGFWNNQGTAILTRVTLSVAGNWKGAKNVGRTFQLIQLGGTVGNKSLE